MDLSRIDLDASGEGWERLREQLEAEDKQTRRIGATLRDLAELEL